MLELFILNAPSVAGRRAEIEAHLHGCAGCRLQVERMEAFYKRVENLEHAEGEGVADHMLARRPDAILRRYQQEHRGLVMPERPRLAQVGEFMRTHPFISGGSVVVGLAILSIAAFLISNNTHDRNPSIVHINPEQGMIEVFNREKEQLWRLPGVNLQQAQDPLFFRQSQRAGAVDIDDDGTSEVLLCLSLAAPAGQENDGFSILNADKSVHAYVSFKRTIKYKGLDYPKELSPSAFVVRQSMKGRSDIYVSALNPRSPMVLARLNAGGEVLGEYWHFGHMPLLLLADVDGDEKEEVILGGVDDTEDNSGGRFPVVVILDPEQIAGVTESPSTKGFGKETSVAEKYHIRFPVSDLEMAINAPGTVANMNQLTYNGQQAVSFWVSQRLNGEMALSFEYIFSTKLQILDVRSSGPSEILHGRLVREGKLFGKIDSNYLDNLKRGVRYADGHGWSSLKTPGPG